MADEMESTEVLELIERELLSAQKDELDPQHELLVAVRSAIADHADDDHDGQAAAALAALLAYGSVSDRRDLDHTLNKLAGLVDGLEGIEDVRYVDTRRLGDEDASLRERLPQEVEHRLTYEERAELEEFITVVFARRRPGPDNEPGPDSGPAPQRGGPTP